MSPWWIHGINCYLSYGHQNQNRQKLQNVETRYLFQRHAPPNPTIRVNEYGIPDWRLEQPEFEVREVTSGPEVHYEIKGKLNTPVPPIRESKM